MLSTYSKSTADEYDIKVGKVKKLTPNLGKKTKYVLHYRNLQLYLSLRMKLTKTHRALQFKQSHWMKKYFDFNTKKRKNAAKDFEKKILKLIINSKNKIINVRLVNNAKDVLKYTSRPTYVAHKLFAEDYANGTCVTFTTALLKKILMLNCYLQIQTA